MRERRLRGAAIRAVLTVLAWLPLRTVQALGAAFGWCAWALGVPLCRVAANNISRCLPDLDARARGRLVRAGMMENGKSMFELAPLWLWRMDRVLGMLDDDGAMDTLREAHATGRGVIIIAPHHGAWEFVGLALSSSFPMTSMFMPGRMGIDRLVTAARERAGGRLVRTDRHGVMAVTRWLRDGGMTGILPDQDPGPDSGLYADFFGIATRTTTLPSKLALRTGARAFITWAERLPRGRGYRLHCLPAPDAFYREPVEGSVAAMNAALEGVVRRNPEQYLWAYKRFRTRPEGEENFYKR